MSLFQPTYTDPNTGKKRKSKVWWYEFTIAGKRVRESTKTTRKTIAGESEKNRRLQLEKALAGIPSEARESRIAFVKERIAAYEKRYGLNHRPKSVLFSQSRLAQVKEGLGDRLVSDLNEEVIYEYISKRKDADASGRTINMELGELSRALGKKWSVLWPGVRKLEERKDVGQALSHEDEKRMLDFAARSRSPILNAFIRIALHTAMRSGEIVDLTWGQVDLSKRIVSVGRAKTEAGRGRQIPLNNDLYEVLKAHAEWFTKEFGATKPGHFLFPFGKPVPNDPTRPTTTLKTSWNTLRKEAKVTCRLHDLRHTVLTKWAEAGVPESTMLALAGHMSRAMLERYSHIRMKSKRAAVEFLESAKQKPKRKSNDVPKESPKVKAKRVIQ